jgi:hypothetical protein
MAEFLGIVEIKPPKLSKSVIYRSRTGSYSVPAIINCNVDSIDPEGVRLGHVPALTEFDAVHLTVFTPGRPGTTRGGMQVTSQNVAGCYQEWDIPYDRTGRKPGSWKYS